MLQLSLIISLTKFDFVYCLLVSSSSNYCDGFVFFGSCYRLDVYIHDYLLKRKLHASAKAFMTEGKVATDPVGNVRKQIHLLCSKL